MKLTTEQQQDLTNELSKIWRLRSGSPDIKMVDFCIKSSKYIYLDNMYIDVCDLKPSIHSEMWYDDTKDSPGTSYQTFFNYNAKYAPDFYENRRYNKTLGLRIHYSSSPADSKVFSVCHIDPDYDHDEYIPVDNDMLIIVNKAVSEVREDYFKRLERYYKRYSNNIYSSGFWVDR